MLVEKEELETEKEKIMTEAETHINRQTYRWIKPNYTQTKKKMQRKEVYQT